jgi:hypothetical protein
VKVPAIATLVLPNHTCRPSRRPGNTGACPSDGPREPSETGKEVNAMKGKRPDYVVSTVVQSDGGQQRWREIGVGFANDKGTITVLLDALPVFGKLVLTAPKERQPEQAAGGS